jgi:ABC-type antimicrobial peptide transport system permease subunit
MVMFTKRTMAALFAIAIASSLIVASSFLGLAFAAKKETGNAAFPTNTMINLDAKDKSSSPKSQDTSAGYPSVNQALQQMVI